ncbi:MAG: bifunctional shikimate kinase/3-dehydroquinate synthase [Elusimicrobia bacterium]|nr:bifunctional shikimate kinase/3-dehydroquinate synthase [Elusimicrobiota bacterium]
MKRLSKAETPSGKALAKGIFLLGFMASGKTSVGRVLARGLGRDFIDTDALVAAVVRRSVARFLKADGEEAFRRIEQKAVAAAARRAARTGAVVSVGGGAVTRSANIRVMRRSGTVVFLDAPLPVLRRRAGKDGGSAKRPLMDQAGRIFERRLPLYRKAAHLSVAADAGSPEKVADAVALLLGPRLRPVHPAASPAAPLQRVTVRTPGSSYPVLIGNSWLGRLPRLLRPLVERSARRRCVLVADERLADPFRGFPGSVTGGAAKKLATAFREDGWDILFRSLPAGEKAKSFKSLLSLYDFFLANDVERRTPVVAFGGGSVGDAAGFAAATFQRGLPLVHVPTTLLAQADSSVGGKTGVNLPLAKNAVGAFHQPILVASDTSLLESLPERDLLSGLAEIVKMALVFDRSFARGLRDRWPGILARDPASLSWALRRSVELKARVVSADERDLKGRRELLNFGHTAGHGLEAAAGYGRFRHGEAVAWGMALAVSLSERRGWLKQAGDRDLARNLLARLSPPPWPCDLDWKRFAASVGRDKKRRGSRSVFVLLKDIGEPVRVTGVGLRELASAVAELMRPGKKEGAW